MKTFAILLPLLFQATAFAQFDPNTRGYIREFRMDIDNTRVASQPMRISPVKKPKDDIKPSVLKHLKTAIKYCDYNTEDCNGANDWIRNFAKGIGGGRCHNRGFNCVGEVLEMCQDQLEDNEITPMYYMACAAFLGKFGERDCAEGRASCAAQLQGSVYFALRAAAACHKSYDGNPKKQRIAEGLMESFANTVHQDVKSVYVKDVKQAQSSTHILTWTGAKETAILGAEKILEFSFERLAMHTAGAVVSSASLPLFAFSGAMLFHEIAASEMHDLVCTNWNHYYNGSYANVSSSLDKMTKHIK